MPKGTKILMVDDDKMLIDLYKERLELAGYQVEVSRDGEEGLAKIHTSKPDLVLLDIMMPKVNGYEALASIKSDPATKDIPVIILSALMRDVNKSKAVESGADDYIIKSEAMPADVIKKIEAVLKKYHKDLPAVPAPPAPPEPPLSPPPPPAPQETPPSEIQFEPSNQPEPLTSANNPAPAIPSIGGNDLTRQGPIVNPAPPAVQAPVQEPVIIPQKPANEKPAGSEQKASPTVIFFLILICFLILASDVFFYMKYITGK